MPVRTTVEIPEPLHNGFVVSRTSSASIRSLMSRRLNRPIPNPSVEGKRVTGPMIKGRGKLGPRYPVDENPHDLVFS